RSRHAKACSAGSRADAMLPTARRRLNDLRDQTLRQHLVKVGLGNFCRMPPDPADLDPAGSPEASSHTVGFAQAGNRYPPSGGSPRAGFSGSTLPERAIQLTPFLLARAKRLHLLGLGFELARKRPVGFSRVSEVFLVTRPPRPQRLLLTLFRKLPHPRRKTHRNSAIAVHCVPNRTTSMENCAGPV